MAAYRSSNYASLASSASPTLSITAPGGIVAGDLLLAHILASSVTTPAGWTALTPNGNSYVFYKIATSTDAAAASFSFSSTATTAIGGSLIAIINPNATTPINTSNFATSSGNTNVVSGAALTPSANVLLLQMASYFDTSGNSRVYVSNSIANNNPTWNTAVRIDEATGNYCTSIFYARYDFTTSTGAATYTTSGASIDNKYEYMVAVNLAAAITPPAFTLTLGLQKPLMPIVAQALTFVLSLPTSTFNNISSGWKTLAKNVSNWTNLPKT